MKLNVNVYYYIDEIFKWYVGWCCIFWFDRFFIMILIGILLMDLFVIVCDVFCEEEFGGGLWDIDFWLIKK